MLRSNNALSNLLAGLIILLLAGCTTLQPPVDAPTQAQQKRLLAQKNWHITGKLGYKSADKGGSAWLDWQQTGPEFTLNLRGPFGAGATQIVGNHLGATLIRSGQEPLFANSASQLTDYLFGWQWPVEELLYWVKGLPAPGIPASEARFNDRHLLSGLRQSGWQLQFSNHQLTSDGLLVPGKIEGQYQQVSFTLVIKEWLPMADSDG